jgi:hypothetical protein
MSSEEIVKKKQKGTVDNDRDRREEEELIITRNLDLTDEQLEGIPRELSDLCSELQFIADCKEGQLPLWDKKTYTDYDSSWWSAIYIYRHVWLGENKEFLLRKYTEVVDKTKYATRKYQKTTYHTYLKRRIFGAICGMRNFQKSYDKFRGFKSSMQSQIDSLSLLCGKDITSL